MHCRRLLSRISNGVRWYLSAAWFLRYPTSDALHFVTGADSSHFHVMLGLLESVRKHEPDATISVWDLGLTSQERQMLQSLQPGAILSKFDFDQYPSFFDIRKDAGGYAWKPTLFAQEVAQQGRLTIWMDAGDLITGRLDWIRRFTRAHGFYSVFSAGTIADWTFPTTRRRMDVDAHLAQQPNLASGLVAVDPQRAAARKVIADWAALAMDQEVIAPVGSSKANHRQDQAVLTILAHKAGLFDRRAFQMRTPPVHVLFHQD